MDFLGWINELNNIARLHNVDGGIFVLIYILSFVPFYLGLFLIFYGVTREVSINKIFRLELRGVKMNATVAIGLAINILGLLMPYLYILLWGRNFSAGIYGSILVIIFLLFLFFYHKTKGIFGGDRTINQEGIDIVQKSIVNDNIDKEKLWEIYNCSFADLNKNAPCKQSFDKVHFLDIMERPDVFKYLVFAEHGSNLIGLGMLTNNFENTPWISEEYFKNKFRDNFDKKNIYYFLGVAIAEGQRHKGFATVLIKKMANNLPSGAMVGFDNSEKMNFFIPHFSDNNGKNKKRKFLDSQNYYIVS